MFRQSDRFQVSLVLGSKKIHTVALFCSKSSVGEARRKIGVLRKPNLPEPKSRHDWCDAAVARLLCASMVDTTTTWRRSLNIFGAHAPPRCVFSVMISKSTIFIFATKKGSHTHNQMSTKCALVRARCGLSTCLGQLRSFVCPSHSMLNSCSIPILRGKMRDRRRRRIVQKNKRHGLFIDKRGQAWMEIHKNERYTQMRRNVKIKNIGRRVQRQTLPHPHRTNDMPECYSL